MGFYLIEFNGLPGSGKTTISRNLITYMRQKGYKVLSDEDIFRDVSNFIKCRELIKAVCNFRCIRFNINLVVLAIDVFRESRSVNVLKKTVKIMRFNGLLYEFSKSEDVDYIVMSEGNVQFILNLLDDVQIKYSGKLPNYFRSLISLYENIIFVNCNIDIAESTNRIIERGFFPNENLTKSDVLGKFMKNRYRNSNELKRFFPKDSNVLNLDMMFNVESNIGKLKNYLGI